jgi:hypothetical protein
MRPPPGGNKFGGLLNTTPCSRVCGMDDQISPRFRSALVAGVRRLMCGPGGFLAGIVVHPVAAPATASAHPE